MMPLKKKKSKKVKKAMSEDTLVDDVQGPKNRKRRKECPDCGSLNIVFEPESERLICQDCGLIFEELPSDVGKSYDEIDLF